MLKKEPRRVNFPTFDALKEPVFRNDQENRIKTELCRNWENGKCEYGEKCYFAHGAHEIREKQAPKVVKEKCENFFKQGYCISGSKCIFSHSDDGSSPPLQKVPQINQQDKNAQFNKPVFIDLECRNL